MKIDRKAFVILYIISILARISKNGRLNGDDAFVLSWYGWAISNGTWNILLQKPLVWIGAYPMSGYPILTELLLGFFLLTTENITLSWHLSSFVITSVGFLSCYSLINDFEISSTAKLSILSFFMFSPMYLLYTYGSIGARASFIALLPLFVKYNIRLLSQNRFKNVYSSLFCLILLLLAHRVAFLLIPFWFVSVLLFVFFRYSKKSVIDLSIIFEKYKENPRMFIVFFLLILGFLGIISTYIFPLDDTKIGPSGLLPFTPGVFGFIELFVDQMLRQGIAVVPISALLIERLLVSSKSRVVQSVQIEFLTLATIVPWFLFLPIAWYVSLFLMLPVSILAGITLESIVVDFSRKAIRSPIIVILTSVFIAMLFFGLPFFIKIKIVHLLIYSILTGLAIISFFYLYYLKSEKVVVVFLMILILTSMYYVETNNTSRITDFPHSYLSKEEIDVANFLKKLEIKGRILSSNYQVGERLTGITGLLFYEDPIGGSGYVSNFTSVNEVDQIKEIIPIYNWWKSASIYSIPETFMIDNYGREVFTRQPTDPWVTDLFAQENTRYVILTKDFRYTVGNNSFDSIFIDKLFSENLVSIVFETDNVLVANLIYLN